MKYIKVGTKEYNDEMQDFSNNKLVKASEEGLCVKTQDFCISSGKLVLSELHETGLSLHRIIEHDFPVGKHDAVISRGSLQSLLLIFPEYVNSTTTSFEQVPFVPYEGNIEVYDYIPIDPVLESADFDINSPAISLMDIDTLKYYSTSKQKNAKDKKITAFDSFVSSKESEKIIRLGQDRNALLAKPYYGNGIYYAWIGLNAANDTTFLLIDLHLVHALVGIKE